MLVHRRVTAGIKFAGTHLYTWVERGIRKKSALPKNTVQNTMLRPGLEYSPLDSKTIPQVIFYSIRLPKIVNLVTIIPNIFRVLLLPFISTIHVLSFKPSECSHLELVFLFLFSFFFFFHVFQMERSKREICAAARSLDCAGLERRELEGAEDNIMHGRSRIRRKPFRK